MSEGKAPYAEIHPMRFIFMIHTKPPPTFSQPDKWSESFIDFVSRCLVKNPESRATAPELLEHDFIKKSQSPEILRDLMEETEKAKETLLQNHFYEEELPSYEDAKKSIPKVNGSHCKIFLYFIPILNAFSSRAF